MLFKIRPVAALIILVCISSTSLLSQNSLSDTDNSRLYYTGVELLSKANFAAARSVFEQYIDQEPKDKLYQAEATYYRAYAAINLYHNDAEYQVQQFINEYPDHPKSKTANYDLGNFYYQQKNYKKAITYFMRLIEQDGLKSNQIQEVNFKLGYAYFTQKKFENAAPYFDKVKRAQGSYYSAANYYSGYIGYETENYNEALKDLKNAEKSESYRQAVPYLIANVHYKLKDYTSLITYAVPYYDNGQKLSAKEDIGLLLADAYYHTQEYENAHRHYTQYVNNMKKSKLPTELMYRIAYVSYLQGDDATAINNFKKVAVQDKGQLGIYSSYYLGILYIKSGNRLYAVTAFDKARRNKFDKDISEESSYQFAKLNYELGRTDLAIETMQDYTKEYQSASHINEINDLLTEAYFSSNNYDQALEYIAGLNTKSDRVKAVYQKASFHKGVEYFNKANYIKAIDMFEESLKYPLDHDILMLTRYWMAETYSIGSNYEGAINQYNQVLWNANGLELKLKSRYGLGYAYYNAKDYPKALDQFKNYVSDNEAHSPRVNYDDALVRLADCYYVTKSYSQAVNYYQQSVAFSNLNNDYAQLHLGFVYGIEGNNSSATAAFNEIINSQKQSKYYDDALFYKAQLEFENGNYELSIGGFTSLLRYKQGSRFAPYAYLKRASAYFNLKLYDKAITDYEAIINRYATHKVAKEVLLPLQEVLALDSRSQEFDAYLAKFKSANPDDNSTEGVEFEAARTLYFNQDYNLAIPKFNSFIDNYPESGHEEQVHYYVAESYYQLGNIEQALEIYYALSGSYTFQQHNRVIARIAQLENQSGSFEKAIQYYQQLYSIANTNKEQSNSWLGMMECYFEIGKYDSSTHYAEKLIVMGNISAKNQNKASLYLGKSAFSKGNYQTAQDEFLNTINTAKDEHGAEAQYMLSEIFYLQKEYNKSIEAVIELNNSFYAYDHWVGKGFLLIADNYVALEEYYQAKGTLNSVIQDFPLVDIVDRAKIKIQDIERKENERESHNDSLLNLSDTLYIDN